MIDRRYILGSFRANTEDEDRKNIQYFTAGLFLTNSNAN